MAEHNKDTYGGNCFPSSQPVSISLFFQCDFLPALLGITFALLPRFLSITPLVPLIHPRPRPRLSSRRVSRPRPTAVPDEVINLVFSATCSPFDLVRKASADPRRPPTMNALFRQGQ